jgi:shikimate kinase
VTAYDRVLLVGMMGAGKTTIGHALSRLIGWPYVDNDELVARATGKSTREVLEQDGERAMRRAESAALDIALTSGTPLIAGVAGGVVTDPLDLDRLRSGGFVVWLRADIATLSRRVKDSDRPWLGGDPAAAMSALYANRMALYAAAADLVLDEQDTTAELLAERIAAELARH